MRFDMSNNAKPTPRSTDSQYVQVRKILLKVVGHGANWYELTGSNRGNRRIKYRFKAPYRPLKSSVCEAEATAKKIRHALVQNGFVPYKNVVCDNHVVVDNACTYVNIKIPGNFL